MSFQVFIKTDYFKLWVVFHINPARGHEKWEAVSKILQTKLFNHDNFGLGSILESGPNKKAKYAHTSIASTPA